MKTRGTYGFITFVPWPFQSDGTRLAEKTGYQKSIDAAEYIRMIALSRIVLNNITNIQSSLLTVGADTAMVSLHAGANDLGSIMIEENVVSAAGAGHRFDAGGIQEIIRRAGFTPARRDQKYRPVTWLVRRVRVYFSFFGFLPTTVPPRVSESRLNIAMPLPA
jgi:cyclic dehypoxanthinyl futalosine synthase